MELHAIGTVEASSVIQVKPQVAGELTKAHFVEGAMVNKGDLLFEIDKRPYIDAQRQAEASLAKDTALLQQAEANLAHDTAQAKYAEADAERFGQLAKEGIVSHSQNEQYRSNSDALHASIRADQAAIESARAAIANDEAAIDRAKLDVDYCDVRSPITGRAGNLLIQAGNLVKANGDNAVVVVNQVTPIWVSFAIPRVNDVRRSFPGRCGLLLSPGSNACPPATESNLSSVRAIIRGQEWPRHLNTCLNATASASYDRLDGKLLHSILVGDSEWIGRWARH